MRFWIIAVVVLGLLGTAAAALGLQYITQQDAVTAFNSWMASRAGAEPSAEFKQTGRAYLAQGRRSTDFGPAGASEGRSGAALCYNSDGHPVPTDEGGEADCRRIPSTQFIDSTERLVAVLKTAQPGVAYEIMPGTYRLKGNGMYVLPVGRADAPIVLRAARLGDVHLELDMAEGFAVQSPYWVFENLDIRGVCEADSACEHAFHLSRDARGTVIRNNRISDFNAQVKINAAPDNSSVPDDVLIDHNNFIDSRPRKTGNPVTKVDSVRASGLTVTGNVIADFAKEGADQRSYGAFSKGGGSRNRFERNLVICEWMHKGGSRIGLSLGGGGTADRYCVGGSCKIEDRGGIIRSNVILGCSDVGIYLRRAADAHIERNLLAATRGIDARFDTTSMKMSGNIFDGRMMTWRGASATSDSDVFSQWRAALLKPVSTRLFAAPLRGNFEPVGLFPASPVTPGSRDFCGTMFGPNSAAGPFSSSCAPDIPALR